MSGGGGGARRLARAAVLLAGVGVAVALVVLAPDLFRAIPWPARKGFGWLAFAGLGAGLGARLLRVRPGDEPPPPDDRPAPGPGWLAWAGPAAVLALAFPLLGHPENRGFGDWDYYLCKYEAARRTVATWGQFPWWDPWTRGGFPLAAGPQCGVAGLAMPLALAFGTSVGLRLATLGCFLIAFEGARRLARPWLVDPHAAAAAGLIYGLNGAVLVSSVAGYFVPMCYPALPWMLHHVSRLDRRPSEGIRLGAWAAFNVLNGIQYLTVYAGLVTGVAWARAARARPGPARRRLLAHTALAAGTFLALAGWRVATTGLVCRDFPRAHASGYDESPRAILAHLLGRPSAATLARAEDSHSWETACYVGPVVLALAAASLAGGWRWWHALALLCGWLAAGSVAWYHPSYWLAHLPVFSTLHVVTRWRFVAILGLAMAAASVIGAWRRSDRVGLRWLANLALAAIAADYLSYGFEVLPVAFSVAPGEARPPGPPLPTGRIVQVEGGPGFPAALGGYGVIRGYEPILGYDRGAPTARTWVGHPAYLGEHRTVDGPARVVSWSPNRIELEARPGQAVWVNQNPGSWWWANGRPAFPGTRCAEMGREFVVRADDRGRVVLEIRPRGLALGVGLHLAGAALVVVTWLVLGRAGEPARAGRDQLSSSGSQSGDRV